MRSDATTGAWIPSCGAMRPIEAAQTTPTTPSLVDVGTGTVLDSKEVGGRGERLVPGLQRVAQHRPAQGVQTSKGGAGASLQNTYNRRLMR